MSELKKPTRLFLVRHGEVVRQGQRKFLGFTDLGLSLRGKKQIQALGQYLKGVSLDQAYASDLIRARDSAGIICQDRRIKPVFRPAFREMNMGDWDGKSWEEIKTVDDHRIFLIFPFDQLLVGEEVLRQMNFIPDPKWGRAQDNLQVLYVRY